MWPVVVFDILRCNLKCVIITRDLIELLLRFVLIHLGGQVNTDEMQSWAWTGLYARNMWTSLLQWAWKATRFFFCFFRRRSYDDLYHLNWNACALAYNWDLDITYTIVSFLHSACISSPVCGNLHVFHFFDLTVKQRFRNEWGPFPQRGPGNVKSIL